MTSPPTSPGQHQSPVVYLGRRSSLSPGGGRGRVQVPPAITMCLPTVVGRDSGDGVSGHLTHTGACAQVVTLTNLMDILSHVQHYQGEMIWGLKGFASQWSKCLFLSIPTPGRSEACSSVMWRTGNSAWLRSRREVSTTVRRASSAESWTRAFPPAPLCVPTAVQAPRRGVAVVGDRGWKLSWLCFKAQDR